MTITSPKVAAADCVEQNTQRFRPFAQFRFFRIARAEHDLMSVCLEAACQCFTDVPRTDNSNVHRICLQTNHSLATVGAAVTECPLEFHDRRGARRNSTSAPP